MADQQPSNDVGRSGSSSSTEMETENPADCTVMLNDEVEETINAGETEEYNFAAALGLRKNLMVSFDKHIGGSGGNGGDDESGNHGRIAAAASISADQKKKQKKGAPKVDTTATVSIKGEAPEFSPKAGGVRSRIMQLEKAAKMEKKRAVSVSRGTSAAAPAGAAATSNSRSISVPRSGFGKKVMTAATSAASTVLGGGHGGGGGRPLSRPRPPMGRSRSNNSNKLSATNKDGPLLTVYLRIRPTPSSSSSSSSSSLAASSSSSLNGDTSSSSSSANTIEIMTNDNHVKAKNSSKSSTTNEVTIRTYPPHNSNAAKVVRTHPSSDMIFGGSNAQLLQDQDATATMSRGGGVKEYKFNSVFGPGSTQDEVYTGVARPLVEGLFPPSHTSNTGVSGNDGSRTRQRLVGQSALLFAYGITNAGKTHTIFGGKSKQSNNASRPIHPDMGIIPRALHDILKRVQELGKDKYQVRLSYFEIYNEHCFDLMESSTNSSSSASAATSARSLGRPHTASGGIYGPVPLKLRESRDGKIFVKGLNKCKVDSLEQGMELIRRAMKKRHTSSNGINSDSSRSHSVCQFDIVARAPASGEAPVKSTQTVDDDEMSVGSTVSGASGYNTEDEAAALRKREDRSVSMWIVDLAGSERTKRTGTTNKSTRQKEAALINSSLMKLMRCLHTLRDNQSSSSAVMVPFRESKLTHLFMNHLTGAAASRTCMVVNVNPSASDYDETQHVLSYATIAKSIVISEDEHDRKRRVGAMNALTHTHDDNGRSLSRPKGRVRSPPKKIARLASKLSPRSMLAKRREQQADAQNRKTQLQNMRGMSSSDEAKGPAAAIAAAKTDNNGPKRKLAKISSGVGPSRSKQSQQMQEKEEVVAHNAAEINKLQTSLAAAQAEAKAAKDEAFRLKEQLLQREAQIRSEVAVEMEGQLQSMRDHYQSTIGRLKQQVGQTPGKSARKVRLDKAEAVIEELMDQVEECEEDMARTREVHEEQIAHLTKIHEDSITQKESEISAIKRYYEEAMKFKESELAGLRAEIDEIKRSRDETVSDYEELLAEERMLREGGSALKENKSPTATSSVRRLRRERTSEVACSNVAPSPPKSSTKKKKKGLFRGTRAQTLKARSQLQSPESLASVNDDSGSVYEEEISYSDEYSNYD